MPQYHSLSTSFDLSSARDGVGLVILKKDAAHNIK